MTDKYLDFAGDTPLSKNAQKRPNRNAVRLSLVIFL